MIKYFVQVDYWGITWRDPQTAFTNLLMAAAALWCATKIFRLRKNHLSAKDWAGFFLFSAIASSIGIIVHGFSAYTSEALHFKIWITMGWMQMVAIAFAQIATVRIYFTEKIQIAKIIASVQFMLCAAFMVYIRRFAAVNIDLGLGLLPIMILNFSQFSEKKVPSALLGTGISLAVIPAVVVATKFMPSPWFNYNDIAHLLLMMCTIVMYVGVKKNLSVVSSRL